MVFPSNANVGKDGTSFLLSHHTHYLHHFHHPSQTNKHTRTHTHTHPQQTSPLLLFLHPSVDPEHRRNIRTSIAAINHKQPQLLAYRHRERHSNPEQTTVRTHPTMVSPQLIAKINLGVHAFQGLWSIVIMGIVIASMLAKGSAGSPARFMFAMVSSDL